MKILIMKNTIELLEKHIKEAKTRKEEHFPSVYHFMPETGWVNDPNGVCYFHGEYHLFYQYNPFDTVWHAPYWGHAVTKDFVTYEYLPVALFPSDTPNYGCFSGGAITANNKIYLCYTRHYDLENSHLEVQHLATSSDGIHFSDTDEPVLSKKHLSEEDSKEDFRDPNPVEIDGVYYVFVGSKNDKGSGQMLVYRSNDLVSFEYHMTVKHKAFGSMLECPDVFRFNGKEVIVFSSLDYEESNSPNGNKHGSYALVGNIDFINKTYSFGDAVKLDYGTDFYAPQTLLAPDNRRIMFSWLNLWNDSSYMCKIQNDTSGRYALPREFKLENGNLTIRPVKEIYDFMQDGIQIYSGANVQKNFYIKAEFFNGSRLKLSGKDGEIEIVKKGNNLYLKQNQQNHLTFTSVMPCEIQSCVLEIFSDYGSLEIFCNNGKAMSTQVLISSKLLNLEMKEVKIITAKAVNSK